MTISDDYFVSIMFSIIFAMEKLVSKFYATVAITSFQLGGLMLWFALVKPQANLSKVMS